MRNPTSSCLVVFGLFNVLGSQKIKSRIVTVVGGFQPNLKNMLVKLDHFPRVRGEKKKYLKPPPPIGDCGVKFAWDTFLAKTNSTNRMPRNDPSSSGFYYIKKSTQLVGWIH